MTNATPFFGREEELAALNSALKDPKGEAILVVGPAGMGKSRLIQQFTEKAEKEKSLSCQVLTLPGVTPSEAPGASVELLLSHAAILENENADFLSFTSIGRKQFQAFVDVLPNGAKLWSLIASLHKRPELHPRQKFQEVLAALSDELPSTARALFVIDADKYLPKDSADFWRLIVRDLPAKIKLVFGLRPEDSVAANKDFTALPNVRHAPEAGVGILPETGVGELVAWAEKETGLPREALASALGRYDGHPYALEAAVGLLRAGNSIEQLPADPTTEKIAEAQWRQALRNHYVDAAKLLKAHAILEAPAEDDLVRKVSGLDHDQHDVLLAHEYIESLLTERTGRRAIYHAILRDHIVASLEADEAREYHQRAADVYRDMLAEAARNQTAPDPVAASRAFLHVQEAEGMDEAIRVFVYQCTRPLMHIGLLDVVINTTEHYLKQVPQGSKIQAVLLGNLARVMKTRGELAEAEKTLCKALEINQSLGQLDNIASNYGTLGVVMRVRGKLTESETMLQKALKMNTDLGRFDRLGGNYTNLGNVMLTRGDLDEAEEVLRKALEIHEAQGDILGLATSYGGLGLVMRKRGKLDQAQEMHRRALENNEKLGRLEGMAIQYGNLGLVMAARGDLKGAEKMHRKALEIDEKLGHLESMANQYGNLVGLMRGQGNLEGAERMGRLALEIEEKLGRREGIARAYVNLGTVMHTRGDLNGAEPLYQEALEIEEQLGRRELIAHASANLGLVMHQRGDLAGAREMWTKARDLFEQVGAKSMVEKVQGWIDQLPS